MRPLAYATIYLIKEEQNWSTIFVGFHSFSSAICIYKFCQTRFTWCIPPLKSLWTISQSAPCWMEGKYSKCLMALRATQWYFNTSSDLRLSYATSQQMYSAFQPSQVQPNPVRCLSPFRKALYYKWINFWALFLWVNIIKKSPHHTAWSW